jgi:tetratricopeptide (TPR) repeat protein
VSQFDTPQPEQEMKQAKHDTVTEPQEWTAVGFLDEFMRIHQTVNDRSFAFLLGAGASITSNIPGAGNLARHWVEELYRLLVEDPTKTSIESWATPENLGIPGFNLNKVAAFYPQVYDKRFGDDPDLGYAYLENAMSSAEPNIGYSILARVLESTRHKVVITTNFDNLVADALSIYTDTFPLVCGHESLAGFVRSRLRRPLVAKIHRDLLLAPKNDPAGISKLDERWAKVLRILLGDYTPIVIGYGGNDGSLMDFLDELQPGQIQGGIYWCYHRPSGKPDDRIHRLVAKHKGKLIPIVGFDEFMLQLGERLAYKPLADEIEQRAQKRVKRYRDQWEQFQKRLTLPTEDSETEKVVEPVREAFAATVRREDSWWSWLLKALAETDPTKREEIYRQGLEKFPESDGLTGSFANFMTDIRKDHDEAERLYRRALELAPDNATNTGNFANFMWKVRKDHDEAERLYRRTLELAPDNATNIGNFANFMWEVRKDHDEAERLYRRALELAPDDATKTSNFANFMWEVRKDHDEAERLYRRALELEPDNTIILANYAAILLAQNHLDEAKEKIKQAFALNRGEVCQPAAEILLYWCLITRMEGHDDTPGLARLKFALEKGFERLRGSFTHVLEALVEKIPPEELAFYSAIGDAILDPQKMDGLERFARWKQVDPIAIDNPWDI